MNQPGSVQRSGVRRIGIAAAAVLLIAAMGAAYALTNGNAPSGDDGTPTFLVEPAPLKISVTETGTIKSRDQVVIKSRVEGRTTILSLVPEGTPVREGDVLIELDASGLRDQRVEQEIRLQNAEAAFIRARENLEVTKNQAASDVDQATLDARFAAEDVEIYNTGEYPKQRKELESKIALANSEHKRAVEKARGSKVLLEEKYISETEYEADLLSAQRAELDLELAEADLDLFLKHTHPRRLDELAAAKKQAAMALERAERKASSDVVQAEADLRAKRSEFDRQQSKLAKIEDQIDKTTIRAPQDGLVVYATSTQFSWRGDTEPLDEGQEVRERQELIVLPNAEKMMAEVKIQEASLDTVELGMPARITIDALPGRVFTGEVTRIAPLADPQSAFMNPDLKVYDTRVAFDESDPALRTGMSCTVEITAAEYGEAIFVPIQAVVRRGSQPLVFVREGGSFVPRPVSIGLDNNRVVRVTQGLQPDEVVSLAPPLDNNDNNNNGKSDGNDNSDGEGDEGGSPNNAPGEADRRNGAGHGDATRGENRT